MPITAIRNGVTSLYRRGKQRLAEGILGRPVVRGNSLERRFLDIGENRLNDKKFSESEREAQRKENIHRYLETPTAEVFSRQLMTDSMHNYLQKHNIHLAPGVAPTLENITNLYHQAETTGVRRFGRLIRLDEKYRFGLGPYNDGLHARLGDLLAQTKEVHDFVYKNAGKKSVGSTLARNENRIAGILRDSLARNIRNDAPLPQISNAQRVAGQLRNLIGNAKGMTAPKIRQMIIQRIEHKEMPDFENSVSLLGAELAQYPLNNFVGNSAKLRAQKRAAAVYALLNTNPENAKLSGHFFKGTPEEKEASAQSFQSALQKYSLLYKVFQPK